MLKINPVLLIAVLFFIFGADLALADPPATQPINATPTIVTIKSWVVRTDQATFKALIGRLNHVKVTTVAEASAGDIILPDAKTTPIPAKSPLNIVGFLTQSQLEEFLQTQREAKNSQVITGTSTYNFDDENNPSKHTNAIINFPKMTLYNNQDSYLAMEYECAYVSDCQPINSNANHLQLFIKELNPGIKIDVMPTVSADQKYIMTRLNISMSLLENIKNIALHLNNTNHGGFIQIPALLNHDIFTTVDIPMDGIVAIASPEGVNSTIVRGKTIYGGATPDYVLFFIQASVLTPDEAQKVYQQWQIQRQMRLNMLRKNGELD
ncbi:MAG TPA: hypothetical protein VMG59_04155 [Phycisphaerae bacterium]|nr:hypothetical protein [Phycisphaerae bacterium]